MHGVRVPQIEYNYFPVEDVSMERICAFAIALSLSFLTATTISAQQVSFTVGISPSSMGPVMPPAYVQPDARAFWPEPLPVLSTYPLTPAVQPLPQLSLPQLPAYGMLIVPQPITPYPQATFMLFGPFSPQLSFAGSFTLPIDRPFLPSRLDPLILTSKGLLLLPVLTEPVCRANPFF
jgi:hypothetical protein